MVLWDANAQRNDEDSASVVCIRKTLCNKHIQNSWRLDVSLKSAIGTKVGLLFLCLLIY